LGKRLARLGHGAGLLAGGFALLAMVVRKRRHPSACPDGQRFFQVLPRLSLRREQLLRLLSPAPGERILEIGPGTGYYTLVVARRVESGGWLDMLDETMRRAGERGIATVVPTQGDAQALPYPDATFDAAFRVATLGEVPDKDAALGELRRVLEPGGRQVVGEGQPDPHMVPLVGLRWRAESAGFRLERSEGGRLAYLARFRVTQRSRSEQS